MNILERVRMIAAAAVKPLPQHDNADNAPGVPAMDADPLKDYVVGGTRGTWTVDGLTSILKWLVDEVDTRFDDAMKSRMLTDPAVSAPIVDLGLGLVEHGVRLLLPEAYRLDPTQEHDEATIQEAERAKEILDFDVRMIERLETPIEELLLSMSDYPAYSCQLAEITFDVTDAWPGGPWIGLKRIKAKPRSSWEFAVDDYWNIVGIAVQESRAGTERVILPPEKFFWLTWWPKDSDPRGRSQIRAAFGPWNGKVRTTPDFLRLLKRFGLPLLVGRTSATASSTPKVTADGTPTGEYESPEQALLNVLMQVSNAYAVAVTHGTEIDVVQERSEGRAFNNAFAYWDRQIILAIVSSYRAYLESQYGSKADSETSESVVDGIKKIMRRHASRQIAWQILYTLNRLNFGVEDADKYTPMVTLDPPSDDVAGEVGTWVQAGWSLAPEHYAEIDARLGLTPRQEENADDEEDAETEQDAAGTTDEGADDEDVDEEDEADTNE